MTRPGPHDRDAESYVTLETMTLSAEAALKQGLDLRNGGKAEESLAYLRDAVRMRPEWAEAQCALGLSYLDLRRTGDAAPHLRRGATLEPRLTDAQYLLGESCLSEGRMSLAVRHLRRAAAANPSELTQLGRLIVALMEDRHASAIGPEGAPPGEPVNVLVPLDHELQKAITRFHQKYWRFRVTTDEGVAHEEAMYAGLMMGEPYEIIRRWLLEMVREGIGSRGKARLIDFGCVTGPLLTWLDSEIKDAPLDYLGIEPMKDYARFTQRRFEVRTGVRIVNMDVTGFNQLALEQVLPLPVDVFWAGGVFAYVDPTDLQACLAKVTANARRVVIRDYMGNARGGATRAFMYNWRFPMFAHNYATLLERLGFEVDGFAPSRSKEDKFGWGVIRARRRAT